MIYWLGGIAGLVVIYLILCVVLRVYMVYIHVHGKLKWDNNERSKSILARPFRQAHTLKGWERVLGYFLIVTFAIPFIIYWIGTLPYDRKHGVKEVD